jgi:hypothetical protein
VTGVGKYHAVVPPELVRARLTLVGVPLKSPGAERYRTVKLAELLKSA